MRAPRRSVAHGDMGVDAGAEPRRGATHDWRDPHGVAPQGGTVTPARALGAVAAVAIVVQCAAMWSGTLAVMALGLLVAAGREESGR